MIKFDLDFLKYQVTIINQLKFISTLLISTSILILFWEGHLKIFHLNKNNLDFKFIFYALGFILISSCFIINIWIIFSLSLCSDIINTLIIKIISKSDPQAIEFEKDINLLSKTKNKDLLDNKTFKQFYKIQLETETYLNTVKLWFRISILILLIGTFLILISKLSLFHNKIIISIISVIVIISVILITKVYFIFKKNMKILKLNDKINI